MTNKYKGREYSEHDFQICLRNFLYNGSIYRTDVIQPIVERFQTLLTNLQAVDCYRFYCSSLLVIYEGDISKKSQVEVRMIDFAKSIAKDDLENYHVGPDSGYILGLSSLIDIFTSLKEKLKPDGVMF